MLRTRIQASAGAAAALGLGLLCVAAIADVLFAPGDRVVSHADADTFFYFARARRFAAAQILQGNLPLWNPHVFSGQPFLGSFQTALLYPPNLLYLVLPLHRAINLDVALHVFLMGLCTFAWVRGRGVQPAAAFFAGAVMMLCGAVSLRVLAGQLTVLAAACWTPLILLAAERLTVRPTLGWTLAGVAAVSLQILAGYPFYVFVSALIVAVTVPLRLARAPERLRSAAALASLALFPVLLTAAQLWTGLHTASESLRAEGVPLWFAASFSLPPENLLTSVAPAVFGDTPNTVYWGKHRYWDDCIFLGVTTLALAVHGSRRGERAQRGPALPLLALMLFLALGPYTPLYTLLFDWLPGFGSFRAPSKFALHASLFAALLAGVGLDRLLRQPGGSRATVATTALAAVALALVGVWLRAEAASAADAGAWGRLVATVANPGRAPSGEALLGAAEAAAGSLWIAAGTAAAVTVLLLLRRRSRWPAYALAALGVGELLLFARAHHDQFSLAEAARPALERFYREHPGDYRVLDVAGRNHAMDAGALAIWGYDPVQLGRSARFGASAHTGRIVHPDYRLPILPNIQHHHPRLGLLRCRYVIEDWSLSAPPREVEGALPRLLLVGRYRRVPPRQALASVFVSGFDPRREAIVEEEPLPLPEPRGAEGSVRLLDESTDHLTVEAELPAAAILVVTDAYSRGWRAIDETAEPPVERRVLPVDYVLRGVPLPAGRHRLRLEYAPAAYRIGRWVSLVSLIGFLAAVALWARLRSTTA